MKSRRQKSEDALTQSPNHGTYVGHADDETAGVADDRLGTLELFSFEAALVGDIIQWYELSLSREQERERL